MAWLVVACGVLGGKGVHKQRQSQLLTSPVPCSTNLNRFKATLLSDLSAPPRPGAPALLRLLPLPHLAPQRNVASTRLNAAQHTDLSFAFLTHLDPLLALAIVDTLLILLLLNGSLARQAVGQALLARREAHVLAGRALQRGGASAARSAVLPLVLPLFLRQHTCACVPHTSHTSTPSRTDSSVL